MTSSNARKRVEGFANLYVREDFDINLLLRVESDWKQRIDKFLTSDHKPEDVSISLTIHLGGAELSIKVDKHGFPLVQQTDQGRKYIKNQAPLWLDRVGRAEKKDKARNSKVGDGTTDQEERSDSKERKPAREGDGAGIKNQGDKIIDQEELSDSKQKQPVNQGDKDGAKKGGNGTIDEEIHSELKQTYATDEGNNASIEIPGNRTNDRSVHSDLNQKKPDEKGDTTIPDPIVVTNPANSIILDATAVRSPVVQKPKQSRSVEMIDLTLDDDHQVDVAAGSKGGSSTPCIGASSSSFVSGLVRTPLKSKSNLSFSDPASGNEELSWLMPVDKLQTHGRGQAWTYVIRAQWNHRPLVVQLKSAKMVASVANGARIDRVIPGVDSNEERYQAQRTEHEIANIPETVICRKFSFVDNGFFLNDQSLEMYSQIIQPNSSDVMFVSQRRAQDVVSRALSVMEVPDRIRLQVKRDFAETLSRYAARSDDEPLEQFVALKFRESRSLFRTSFRDPKSVTIKSKILIVWDRYVIKDDKDLEQWKTAIELAKGNLGFLASSTTQSSIRKEPFVVYDVAWLEVSGEGWFKGKHILNEFQS